MSLVNSVELAAQLNHPQPERPLRPGQRPADDRPVHDDERLKAAGVNRYASRRLVLYSDIDPAVARSLPPLVDDVYPEWVRYFGEPAPAGDGSNFQLTGYLMKDRGLFRELGLLPEEFVDFQHGQHRGYRFWMAEQNYDYYRRHLLLHEATHCYMMIEPVLRRPPLFYLEGMAELFGTHTTAPDGTRRFCALPDRPDEAVGFGRIEMIQRACARGESLSLPQVWDLGAEEFTRSREEPYAWSWAACRFLDSHPQYRDRFRRLAAIDDGTEFRRTLDDLFATDHVPLDCEWELFIRGLTYGFDIERSAMTFGPGRTLTSGEATTVEIQADRGWQSSGVAVRAGEQYGIVATGTVTLANEPKPWVSEPAGVTIRYSGGRPLGRLTAVVVPTAGEARPSAELDCGGTLPLNVPANGVLYLRVNDDWNRLADNAGSYTVTIRRP